MTTRHEDAEARVESWARTYGKAMTKVATRVLGDRDAADDVVQRVFMTVLSEVHGDPEKLARIRKPLAWMLKITRNMATDVLKTEARRGRLRRENGDDIREILFPERDAGIERDPQADRVLEAAPRVLTKRQLEVFRLGWDGMKDGEVAREMGMKRNTVRWHRMEAIRRLRVYFGNRAGE